MSLPRSRIRTKRIMIVFALLGILAFFTPSTCGAQGPALSNYGDLQGIKVAVYISANGTQADGSSLALSNMFEWMNASVDFTNETHIKAGGLADYDILVMPGGSTLQYVVELGQDGEQEVRDFVSGGGSYFGICGGSRFACDEALLLFNGSYTNPVPNLPGGTYLVQLTVNKTSGIPGFSEEPDTLSTLFWGSTYFSPHNSVGMIPVATYPNSSLPAMIALEYGQGSVFLSSPHPEYEEGSNRDGTSAFDYMNDADSEWGLMLKVAQWLIESSTVEMTDSSPVLPYAVVASVVVVSSVALVLVIRRR